jgi:hypothetical protein
VRLLRDGETLTALWSVDDADRARAQLWPYRTYVVAEHRRDGSPVTVRNYPGSGHVALAFTNEAAGARFLARLGAYADALALRQTTGDRVVALASALGVAGIVLDAFGPGVPGVIALGSEQAGTR